MIDADKGGKRAIILILVLLFSLSVWLILYAHSVFPFGFLLLFM